MTQQVNSEVHTLQKLKNVYKKKPIGMSIWNY